jgi:hypothetical protein
MEVSWFARTAMLVIHVVKCMECINDSHYFKAIAVLVGSLGAAKFSWTCVQWMARLPTIDGAGIVRRFTVSTQEPKSNPRKNGIIVMIVTSGAARIAHSGVSAGDAAIWMKLSAGVFTATL